MSYSSNFPDIFYLSLLNNSSNLENFSLLLFCSGKSFIEAIYQHFVSYASSFPNETIIMNHNYDSPVENPIFSKRNILNVCIKLHLNHLIESFFFG